MGRVEITCLALGAALVTVGAGLVFVPAAPIVLGGLLIAAGVDRGAKS
jgi:hypothetical protein